MSRKHTTGKPRRLPLVVGTATQASFSCTACGKCCVGWRVDVDSASYDALGSTLRPGPNNPKGHSRDACMTLCGKPTPSAWAAMHLVDGRCVFLDEDNLCYLHRHFGPESKPRVCRSFPFKGMATPSGRFLTATFACRGMAQALRRTAGRTETIAMQGPVDVELGRTGTVPLAANRTGGLSALGLGDLVLGMHAILALDAHPLEARLSAIRLWLETLAGTQKRLHDSDVRASLSSALTLKGAELLGKATAQPTDAIAHLTVLKAILVRRMGLGLVDADWMRWFRILIGRYRLEGTSMRDSARRHRDDLARTYRASRADIEPLLTTYLANKLFYDERYLSLGVIPAVHSTIVLFALIRLFAVARAAAQGSVVDEALLLECIEMVERSFAHAPSFFEFWKGEEAIEVHKPAFASLVLGG